MKLGRWFKPDEKRQAATEQLKSWVRAALHLSEHVTVSVSEIECGDPKCPGGIETAVLVRGKASVEAAFKLPGPLDQLNKEIVIATIEALQSPSARE